MSLDGIPRYDGRGMVSLSYDGSMPCHLDTALTHLNRFGLRGTFYADPAPLVQRARDWQDAHTQGHEIANGCLLGAALPDGSLPAWTPQMIAEDIEAAEALLRELFGRRAAPGFAYPFGSPRCAEGQDYRDVVEALGYVARSGVVGFNRPETLQPTYLRCIPAWEMGAEDLISFAEAAASKCVWAIFAFEGVGVGEPAIDAAAHLALCRWLSDHADTVRVAPVSSAATEMQAAMASPFRMA